MFAPRGLATLIGSLPHTDAKRSMELILQSVPQAPIWPQLPNRHWREGFLPQYAEGLPGLVMHPADGKVSLDSQQDSMAEQMAAFYEKVFATAETNDFSDFAISEEASVGLPTAIEAYSERSEPSAFVKVHTTGPISFALTVTDENDTAIQYRDDLADLSLQNAIMKSRWQIQQFKPYGREVICFLDEPSLSAFGSSTYITLTRERVVESLSTAINAIHEEGALVGIHVCGNTEWSMLIEAGADIINFDAYSFGESIAIYSSEVHDLLKRGGALAWGIVPTSPKIHEETAEHLFEKLTALVDHLASHGIDKDLIWQQSFVTPSCGMGTMQEEEAEKIMLMLAELSNKVQASIA